MECFNCGVSGSKARLFDVISREGIVKVCENCFSEENMPIIRKPTSFQLKESGVIPESYSKKTVYERLSNISGIQKKETAKSELLDKQETALKDIVNRNFEMALEEVKGDNLVDNFHWIIMRARRLKHLAQNQFAKEIAEPEAAIEAIEKGILPKDSSRLINKIESYLGIKLRKKGAVRQAKAVEPAKEFGKKIDFDPMTAKTLTISDLKDMKRQREEEILGEKTEEKRDNSVFGGSDEET